MNIKLVVEELDNGWDVVWTIGYSCDGCVDAFVGDNKTIDLDDIERAAYAEISRWDTKKCSDTEFVYWLEGPISRLEDCALVRALLHSDLEYTRDADGRFIFEKRKIASQALKIAKAAEKEAQSDLQDLKNQIIQNFRGGKQDTEPYWVALARAAGWTPPEAK